MACPRCGSIEYLEHNGDQTTGEVVRYCHRCGGQWRESIGVSGDVPSLPGGEGGPDGSTKSPA